MLVLAGGGYSDPVAGNEGVEVAEWLASLGLHAFEKQALRALMPASRKRDRIFNFPKIVKVFFVQIPSNSRSSYSAR